MGDQPGAGDFGIVDPQDLQPLALKDYFLAYLSDDPEKAVQHYAAVHPEVAERVQRYLDHLQVQRILQTRYPATRADQLLPYYFKRTTWDLKNEVRDGLVACGAVAGGKLVPIFRDPQHRDLRQDIILLWSEVKYADAAPILIDLLSEHDQFWAAQVLDKDWWNSNSSSESDLTRQRRQNYGEVYYAVCALRAFRDPKAKEVIERTKQRWETIDFENKQIVEACDAALKALPGE